MRHDETVKWECGVVPKSDSQAAVYRSGKTINSRNQRQSGFTLIELVIVLVALGVLSAFAADRLSGFSDQVDRQAAGKSIETAAQRVVLSQNLSNGQYDTCDKWSSFKDDIVSFIEADQFDDTLRGAGFNSDPDYTQSISLPGVSDECKAQFRDNGNGITAIDIVSS